MILPTAPKYFPSLLLPFLAQICRGVMRRSSIVSSTTLVALSLLPVATVYAPPLVGSTPSLYNCRCCLIFIMVGFFQLHADKEHVTA
jgi:hypothetical protein